MFVSGKEFLGELFEVLWPCSAKARGLKAWPIVQFLPPTFKQSFFTLKEVEKEGGAGVIYSIFQEVVINTEDFRKYSNDLSNDFRSIQQWYLLSFACCYKERKEQMTKNSKNITPKPFILWVALPRRAPKHNPQKTEF